MNRTASIAAAAREEFDVCIIGGGITGAGLLANATERGWKALLVEKNDFASGTSSKSSKVIHGGLRYLKNFKFSLVNEALRERNQLLKRYPHLIKPIAFLVPTFHSKLKLLLNDIFLFFYDGMAGKSVIHKHSKIDRTVFLQKVPGFKQEELKGAVLYWEGITNDSALTIEVIAEAVLSGQLAFNYVKAVAFHSDGNKINSLACYDSLNNKEVMIKAKVYVNATGAWTDHLLALIQDDISFKLKPGKGVHLVIHSEKIKTASAIVIPSVRKDKRYLYLVPWQDDLTLLGATDTEYSESPDDVHANEEEVNYILSAVNTFFPSANLSRKDVLSVFAGLRPLVSGKKNLKSYDRTREYEIWWSKENLINIAGGKLTSFLSMGKSCLDAVALKHTELRNIQINGKVEKSIPALTERNDASAGNVNESGTGHGIDMKRFYDSFKLKETEISFFTRSRFAQQVEDILTRRTTVTYRMSKYDAELVQAVAMIMARELKKDNSWIAEQLSAYHLHWLEYHPSFLNS